MSKSKSKPQKTKQPKEKVRQVQELRRSSAAGPHKGTEYRRKPKYPNKYDSED